MSSNYSGLMEKRTEIGGSDQASSSDDGQLIVATVRKVVQNQFELMGTRQQVTSKEVEVMVIRAVLQIWPILENHKVVKEEITALAKFYGVNRSNSVSNERNLLLKFLDEVSLPVLTGKHIKGNGDTPMRVALVDQMTGEVVKSEPESWGRVELFLLDDNDHEWRPEDFNNRIIKEGDKTKPRFAKRVYIKLKNGIGNVGDARLGHDSKWMKKFECRLGARMENFNGVKVQEAWTGSFVVLDGRGEFQRKSIIPSLSDSVRVLKNIDDACCQHLNDNNINTVKDFLIMQSIDPQKLQQIVSEGAKWKAASASDKWKATVDHAQTCIVDDRSVLYYESPEINTAVAFKLVGGLKGVIQHSHFIPYVELSEEQKGSAHKLLLSAYQNQDDIIPFEGEDALLHQFPLKPYLMVDAGSWSPGYRFFELDNRSETCGDTSSFNFPDEDDNIMNNINHNESCPDQQSNGGSDTIHFVGVIFAMLWAIKVRKLSKAWGGIHVQKRKRTD